MEQPKEIEERFVQQIIKTCMNQRRWTKRLLVISTAAATLSFVTTIMNVFHGRFEVAMAYCLLCLFNIVNGIGAYRRVI